MNKQLTIFDDNAGVGNILKKDSAGIKGTDIVLKSLDNGKVLFRGSNKVIVSGSEFNAIKDFDYDGYVQGDDFDFLSSIPSYDTAFKNAGRPFYTENGIVLPDNMKEIGSSGKFSFYTGETGTDSTLSVFSQLNITDEKAHRLYRHYARRVCLWCVGIDGCGVEASRVFKVHNTKWIAPYGYFDYNNGSGESGITGDTSNLTCLIPFKYRTTDADLSDTYRKQYYGRMQTTNAIGYFFKTFDEKPTIIRRYADDSSDLINVTNPDGTLDVWKDKRVAEAETVVQLKMSVSASDCREYFNRNVGVNDSKINTLSLCTAVPYINSNGRLEYADIRPFTRFNFPNEALIDYSKGIDITYYLYY